MRMHNEKQDKKEVIINNILLDTTFLFCRYFIVLFYDCNILIDNFNSTMGMTKNNMINIMQIQKSCLVATAAVVV